MADATVSCNKCSQPFTAESFTAASTVLCPSCGTALTGFLFPALYRGTLSTIAPELLLTDSESSCFFHTSKRAVVACEGCGRFLCGLCDLEWEGRHLCSACLESAKKKGKMKSLENQRFLYDDLALAISVWPVVLIFPVYFTFITAPISLYIALRHWRSQLSLVPRTKIRFVIAILFSLAQIAGWVLLVLYIISKVK